LVEQVAFSRSSGQRLPLRCNSCSRARETNHIEIAVRAAVATRLFSLALRVQRKMAAVDLPMHNPHFSPPQVRYAMHDPVRPAVRLDGICRLCWGAGKQDGHMARSYRTPKGGRAAAAVRSQAEPGNEEDCRLQIANCKLQIEGCCASLPDLCRIACPHAGNLQWSIDNLQFPIAPAVRFQAEPGNEGAMGTWAQAEARESAAAAATACSCAATARRRIRHHHPICYLPPPTEPR